MIGPSHGIHQSSWLKLHWVVSSVRLVNFLSFRARSLRYKCNWNSCKGEFFFHFGSISHNTKWCDLFFEILINWSILYFWSKFHWVPSENYRWRNWLKKKKQIYIYMFSWEFAVVPIATKYGLFDPFYLATSLDDNVFLMVKKVLGMRENLRSFYAIKQCFWRRISTVSTFTIAFGAIWINIT